MAWKWLTIENKDGWVRRCPLERRIIYIGSQPEINDISLESAPGRKEVDHRIQLIPNGSDFILVELPPVDSSSPAENQLEGTYASQSFAEGDTFEVGEYKLRLDGGQPADPDTPAGSSSPDRGGAGLASSTAGVVSDQANNPIGLSLYMPKTRLRPGQELEGFLTVRNQGDHQKGNVKIELGLEADGLDADCYSLEPGPRLTTDGSQTVRFFLKHCGHKPPAGDLTITLFAAAPWAYPGVKTTLSQVIQVDPVYKHRVRLLRPKMAPVGAEEPADLPAAPQADQPGEADSRPPPAQVTADRVEVQQPTLVKIEGPEQAQPEPASQKQRDDKAPEKETIPSESEAGPHPAAKSEQPALAELEWPAPDLAAPQAGEVEAGPETEPEQPGVESGPQADLSPGQTGPSQEEPPAAEVESPPPGTDQPEIELSIEEPSAADTEPPPPASTRTGEERETPPPTTRGQSLPPEAGQPGTGSSLPPGQPASPPPAVAWPEEEDEASTGLLDEKQVLKLKQRPSSQTGQTSPSAEESEEGTEDEADWWAE